MERSTSKSVFRVFYEYVIAGFGIFNIADFKYIDIERFTSKVIFSDFWDGR